MSKVKVEPEVAAARFLTFVGASAVSAGALLVITVSAWFWILCVFAWPILFLGLWGKNAIKMGISKEHTSL